MARYLLAAEADKIQDFVFRVSRLREVVGGSQLLSRFCQEGAEALLVYHGGNPATDIIINDGGAFRVLFGCKRKAQAFGRDLAELYRRVADSSLTVAAPVPYDGPFQAASKQAQEYLREAKNQSDVPGSSVHLPYLAFCASCGITIANERYKRHADERENYYCASCRQKENERNEELRKIREEQDRSGFLGLFQDAVSEACKAQNRTHALKSFPQDADRVGAFDWTGRRYVAYLLADGNGMGRIFSACPDEDTMKKLSQALSKVLRASLAEPCPDLLDRVKPRNKDEVLPVLPLILGGDDLFVLLPSPWAIDFAARFCREYEHRMADELQSLGLLDDERPPTMAAAVVICKASYPHSLAHRYGEDLLQEAKQLARGLEAHPDPAKRGCASVLHFDMITGNEVGRPSADESSGRYRPTACPYFVREDISEPLQKAGIPVQQLIQHRLSLAKAELSGKRRAQLEHLYESAATIENDEEELINRWKRHCDQLLRRIKLGSSKTDDAVKSALGELGNATREDIAHWRFLDRPMKQGSYGHGLPDLLRLWDYAYDLTQEVSEYEGG